MDVPTSAELKNLQDRFRELKKTCFILGASGETGKALLAEILRLQLFSKVTLIGRRKLNLEGELYHNVLLGEAIRNFDGIQLYLFMPSESGEMAEVLNNYLEAVMGWVETNKLKLNPDKTEHQELVDFEKLDDYAAAFQGHDVGFCSLGASKATSTEDEYVRVNRDYVVHSARLAKAGGCHHFVLVTALCSSSSSMFLLLQLKGEAEDGVKAVGFDNVSILQPGMLLCDREKFQLLEWISRKISEVVAYVFPTFFSVPINILAKAMVNLVVMAQANGQKLQVLTNPMIHTFGNIE